MSEEITVPMREQRDIATVTTEIRTLHRQAQVMVLNYAIEIGRRLQEAKAMLNHGEWGDWLKTEVDFSQSTAQNFMRIFSEYGDRQTSLFGDAKSQTLGNLPYTHALKLLALPDDEREGFAEENNVQELSTRELDKLIRERDDAKRELEDARKSLEDAGKKIQEAEKAAKEKEDGAEELEELRRKLDTAQRNAESARAELTKAGDAKHKAEEAARKAKEEMQRLKENPEVSEEVLEKIRTEAAESARAAAEKDMEEKRAAAEEAGKNARDAAAELEELRKKLALADPATSEFKVHFAAVQTEFAAMKECMERMTDKTRGEKLRGAVSALLEKMGAEWNG